MKHQAAPATAVAEAPEGAPLMGVKEWLSRILGLQCEATHPLNPVAETWA